MLVAGQYPGGSDDELPPLNIMDPSVARDRSPDPRRHSNDKLVPDLVVLRGDLLFVLEMKPRYSASDERKLEMIIGERRPDLFRALRDLGGRRGIPKLAVPEDLVLVPTLGFVDGIVYPKRQDFAYLLVSSLDAARLITPSTAR